MRKRQIALPKRPIASTVVGRKVSPSFPETMFPILNVSKEMRDQRYDNIP